MPPAATPVGSVRSLMNVSAIAPAISVISWPVTKRVMSMMWAFRSPWAPEPARFLSNRHNSGTASSAQSCK